MLTSQLLLQALHHPYFRNQPIPTPFIKLPRHPTKEKADGEGDHPLLSHSNVKNQNRTAGDVASNRNAAQGTGGNAATANRKRTALGSASPNTVARLQKIARRLAYD